MAIKSIGKIVLYEPLTQDNIDALLASSDTIIFEIERRYVLADVPDLLSAVLPTQFDDVSVDYIQALKDLVDVSTFIHEENAMMWVIKYNSGDKEFDLTSSYIRDEKDTNAVMSGIPTDQLLQAVFVTPGLNGPVYTTVDLPYNGTISTTDRDALLAVGLELNLSITGSLFSVKTQKVPYKVSFIQPSSVVTERYSIKFNYENQIIEI
jgi:hypothetical protein